MHRITKIILINNYHCEPIFYQCKEKMRPVKKVLKALDDPEEKKNELRYVNHMQECLIEIGSHIGKCLEEFKDPDKIREWRRFSIFILSINDCLDEY